MFLAEVTNSRSMAYRRTNI